MSKEVKRRVGTTAEHVTFIGAAAESTIDEDKNTIVVHDGSTAGGFPLAREDLNNVSGANIKTLYEAEPSAYTDAKDTAATAGAIKLAGIESGATGDQTGAEIKAAYEGEANTNEFSDSEQSKLSGIEASADVTDDASVRAALASATADIAVNSQKITGVTDPSADQDAATKAYVDGVASGLDTKNAVRVATTANITLSGEQTLDGVLTSADRVLVKDQSNATENGIYISAAGAWSRASDADNTPGAELGPGAFTFVEEGTDNVDNGFVATGTATGSGALAGYFDLGVDDITWTQFSGAGLITAGTNLNKDGNTINLDTTLTNFASTGIDDNATSTAITIDSSENIGIGVSPGSRLHVVDNASSIITRIESNQDADPTLLRFANSSSGTAARMRVQFNDNFNNSSLIHSGSGTSESGAFGPGGLTILNDSISGLRFAANYSGSPAGGDIKFFTNGQSGSNERMVITTDGKVGISSSGVNDPDGTLHIHTADAGAFTADAAADDLIIEGSGDVGIQLVSPDAGFKNSIHFGRNSDPDRGKLVYDTADNTMRFTVNTDEHLTLYNTGTTGLGKTTPIAALDIDANAVAGTNNAIRINAVAPAMYWESESASHYNFKVSAQDGTTATWQVFGSTTAGSDALASSYTPLLTVAAATKRVGIGISSPEGKLHVQSATAGAVVVNGNADELVIEGAGTTGMSFLSGASQVQSIYFGDVDDNDIGQIRYDHGDNSMYLVNNATTALRINSSQAFAINSATGNGQFNVKGAGTLSASFSRDNNFGDSTQNVVIEVGNSGTGQGNFRIHYFNHTSTSGQIAKLEFNPRNVNDDGQDTGGSIIFTKDNDLGGTVRIGAPDNDGVLRSVVMDGDDVTFTSLIGGPAAGSVGLGRAAQRWRDCYLAGELDISNAIDQVALNINHSVSTSAVKSGIFVNNTSASGQAVRIINSGTAGPAALGIVGASTAGRIIDSLSASNQVGIFAKMSHASYTSYALQLETSRAANSAFHFLRCRDDVDSSANDSFRLRGDGEAFADGSWTGSGADYADYFEWEDGNPENQDRVGYSVVAMSDRKIEMAYLHPNKEPIGIVSGNPASTGNSAWNGWENKYLRDDFNRYILDEKDERILNPDFDSDLTYAPREERPEWDAVGLVGRLPLRTGQPVASTWVKLGDISTEVEEWLVK